MAANRIIIESLHSEGSDSGKQAVANARRRIEALQRHNKRVQNNFKTSRHTPSDAEADIIQFSRGAAFFIIGLAAAAYVAYLLIAE